ncbi:hypothetical protein CEXT_16581 [Caerostris extrusa]|uniref:Uncharacterized protein n=1 Tax=Caerostris extrusa TaxID=172846 RepID=A0AAV4RRP9_CAEEX|nr:hypothetical protein CEXT_16581 [Caerostris extrusa]
MSRDKDECTPCPQRYGSVLANIPAFILPHTPDPRTGCRLKTLDTQRRVGGRWEKVERILFEDDRKEDFFIILRHFFTVFLSLKKNVSIKSSPPGTLKTQLLFLLKDLWQCFWSEMEPVVTWQQTKALTLRDCEKFFPKHHDFGVYNSEREREFNFEAKRKSL